MKRVKYTLKTTSVSDTSGVEETVFNDVYLEFKDAKLQSAIAFAQKEAYNGEYTVEDAGADPEPTQEEDLTALAIDHEYRLTLLELGLTE